MKTLVIIVLLLMAWKGHAICGEFSEKSEPTTPQWLEDWYEEIREEERQKEEALQKRNHDVRKDEGEQRNA